MRHITSHAQRRRVASETRGLRAPYVLLGALALLFTQFVGCTPTEPAYRQPQELVGNSAPKLAERSVGTIERDGALCTLRVIWATWCEPCAVELPALDDWISAGEHEANVELVVADDVPDDEVSHFLATHEVEYGSYTQQAGTLRHHGVRGVPTAYLIDRTGTVVDTHEGSLTRALVDELFDTAGCGRAPN